MSFFLPPYALKTFLCLKDNLFRSAGLLGLIPFKLTPVIGHFGTDGRFFKYWKTNLPPGVRTFFLLFELVLYDNRRLYVIRCTI